MSGPVIEIAQAYIYKSQGPDQVDVGRTAATAIRDWIEKRQNERVILLTSPSVARTNTFRAIAEMLGKRHVGTYAEVRPHSPRECSLDVAQLARTVQADVMIGIGGGSVMDATKVAQLCLWAGLQSNQDIQAYRDAGSPTLSRGGAWEIRSIAVPTTLSAAEFNSLAGVTDSTTGKKESYEDRFIVPELVVLDPAALAETPNEIVLSTGVRTIDHCVEAYCSVAARPFSDALSVEALKLLLQHLSDVKAGNASPNTYLQLLTAAWMAISGPISGVPLGASHGIGRVLGAVANILHGHTSAILLPAVLAWNAQDPVAAARQRELLTAVGANSTNLADFIGEAISALGQPRTLSGAGVKRSHLASVAKFGLEMLQRSGNTGNARQIMTEQEVWEILEFAW